MLGQTEEKILVRIDLLQNYVYTVQKLVTVLTVERGEPVI